jgi:hypothetical protein
MLIRKRIFSWRIAVPVALVVSLAGILVVLISFAAGPLAAIEVESGTLSGGAVPSSLIGASGGQIVKFGTGTVPVPTPISTPVPTATPVGTRLCPSYPAFPDANCTGVPAGTNLTASGSLNITIANTVIQNLDISGNVRINASNVTIKNCKIHGSDYYGVQVVSGDVTIMDSEIYGFSDAAIGFNDWKGYRLNIHSMLADGAKFGSNVVLEDSYIHDFVTSAGAHSDGGQMQSGEENITIRHNNINITGPSPNAALMMAPSLGPNGSGPVIIDRNLLGSGNYTLYIVDGANGLYHESGYTVTNNHFLRNYSYGPINVNEPAANITQWSGNVFHDNGSVINY